MPQPYRAVFWRHATLLFLFLVMQGCSHIPQHIAESAPKQTPAGLTGTDYIADTSLSYIRWAGSRPGKKHFGTLRLRNGGLAVKDDRVTGGRFAIEAGSLSRRTSIVKGMHCYAGICRVRIFSAQVNTR